MRLRGRSVVLLGLLSLAAGCQSRGASPTATNGQGQTDSAPMPLPCEQRIEERAELPNGYEVVADAVALPTELLGVSPMHEDDIGPFEVWAKSGLRVRAAVPFTISVADPDVGAIGWGTPPRFGHAVQSSGCPGEGWLAFPGGYLTDRPRCLELLVTSGEKSERFSVGVGQRCPD